MVHFVHDNSQTAPAYAVAVTDGRLTTDPQAAMVDFDVLPLLVNNQLTINQGQTIILNAMDLSATQSGSAAGDLSFIISNSQHGHFAWVNSPSQPITVFQQQNITDQLVEFVHDNSATAPAYQVSVSDGRAITNPQSASIDFDTKPVLENNQLTVNQGEIVTLTTKNLQATHAGGSDSTLTFLVSNAQHGYFQEVNATGQAVIQFQQQEVTDSHIQFVHDNSEMAPAYWISVTDGRATSDGEAATIDFDALPVLETNQLTINQGQTITVTAENLYASHSTCPEGELNFIISNYQHGHFAWTNSPSQSITVFQQQNITDSRILFVHDDSVTAPGYDVVVSDGRMSSPSQTASIDFDTLPILENNKLWINQGQTVVLNATDLKASHDGTIDPDLSFLISNCQHGRFQWTNTSSAITVFQQANITKGLVSFIHDNSRSSPSYLVSASDGRAASNPQAATIYFNGKSGEAESSAASLGVILGATLGGAAAIVAGCLYVGYKYRRNKKESKLHLQSAALSTPLLTTETKEEASLEIPYKELEFKENDKLGESLTATVYRGSYRSQPVAIKKICTTVLDEKALTEFKQETEIMASLNSEYVVELRGRCSQKPNYCIVMELMPKGSLNQFLKNPEPVSLVVLLRIGLDVVSGLSYLHEQNITHGDLKSLNILLDGRLRAKISDFGLSKVKSELTNTQVTKSLQGTLNWMAPEQFDEKATTSKAADIYACGLILWELINKPYRTPFEGLAVAALISAKLTRGEHQETIPKDCSEDLSRLMRSCWREAKQRPEAQQLAKSLQGIFDAAQSGTSSPLDQSSELSATTGAHFKQ